MICKRIFLKEKLQQVLKYYVKDALNYERLEFQMDILKVIGPRVKLITDCFSEL